MWFTHEVYQSPCIGLHTKDANCHTCSLYTYERAHNVGGGRLGPKHIQSSCEPQTSSHRSRAHASSTISGLHIQATQLPSTYKRGNCKQRRHVGRNVATPVQSWDMRFSGPSTGHCPAERVESELSTLSAQCLPHGRSHGASRRPHFNHWPGRARREFILEPCCSQSGAGRWAPDLRREEDEARAAGWLARLGSQVNSESMVNKTRGTPGGRLTVMSGRQAHAPN